MFWLVGEGFHKTRWAGGFESFVRWFVEAPYFELAKTQGIGIDHWIPP